MLKLVEAPEPFGDLEDIKAHLAIVPDDTSHDDRLTPLIAAACSLVERESNRAIAPQTWQLVLPCFGSRCVQLPKPPCVEVTSVKYFDLNNVEQTLATDGYRVLVPHEAPAWIEPVTCWPSTVRRGDAVTIEFQAGYETPPPIAVHIVKLLVASWDQLREGEVAGTITKSIELGVNRLMGMLAVGVYV